MSGIAIGLAAVAVGGTAFGAIESYEANKNAAAVTNATAAFNSRVDTAQAEQLDLNTLQNIDTERQDEKTYLSREAAGYAAGGVLATTGSALHAQLTNVGRFTQKIQQQYVNSQLEQQRLYMQGLAGVAEGSAQAGAYDSAATLALITGAAKIAGQVGGDFSSGTF